MEPRPELTEAILQVVDNQLRAAEPPETKSTFDRLTALGYAELEARNLLAYAVFTEMNEAVRQKSRSTASGSIERSPTSLR